METKNFSGLVVSNEPQANKKFFGAAVFQKCCRGVGEQPTFAKQIELHNEMKQKSKRKSQESQLPLKSEGCNKSQGFRGNCDSQGKLGMCPSLAEPVSGGFSKSHVSHETIRNPLQLVPRNSCKIVAYCFRETRRGGLGRPASKSCRFSHHPLRVPKAWHRDFAACGQRSGLLALNLANIFEKLLDQKTFVCLRLVIESQLSNKFASQMWAARPHLGSIFKKLLHRKTFYLPAACMLQPASYCPPYHKNFTVITAYPLTNAEKKRIL